MDILLEKALHFFFFFFFFKIEAWSGAVGLVVSEFLDLRHVRCRRLGLAGKLVHELPRFHGNASDHLLKETETGLEPLRPCSRALDLIEALSETWHRPVLWERA